MSDIRIPDSLNHLAESAQASAHDAAHLLNRAADHAGEIALAREFIGPAPIGTGLSVVAIPTRLGGAAHRAAGGGSPS